MAGFVIPTETSMKLQGRLPVGQHICKVESVEENGVSQEKQNPKFRIKLVCTEGEHEDRVAWDNVVASANPKYFTWKILPYGIAAGVVDEDGSGEWQPGAEMDLEDIVGANVLITIEEEEATDGSGRMFENVTRVEPVG